MGRLQNFQRQFLAALQDSASDFAELGLQQDSIATLTINTQPIQNILLAIDEERTKISKELDAAEAGSAANRRASLAAEIEELRTKLSAPQREYQDYLQKLKEWEEGLEKIIGNAAAIGSLKYLEKQIVELGTLPAELARVKRKRNRKMLEIFKEKQKLRGYYSAYYGAVQEFLARHPLAASEQFRLTFNVSIVQTGFAEDFLARINQRKVGPFAGVDEGTSELRRLLNSTNFDSALATRRFIKKLFRKMAEHDGKKLEVKDQLKQGGEVQALYDLVFSLRYVSPIYSIRWDDKGLEQLSPGERGNLLLIFYLLVDRDDIPLVIDQPEENLDNQTVFKTLVPCIKDAKKRRQIIMVTHNPNLAVVCDAEQLICADMRKDYDNEVTYTCGSIEAPEINRKIVDVLEGTRPAFDKRDDKYQD